jgi:thiamine-monophosphate kinase
MSPSRSNKATKKSTLSELELIRMLQKRTARSGSRGLIRGIGDDCAILRVGRGEDVVVTTDFSLENIHFRRDWHAPESAGHRCLTRGLSDLAAMGARPVAALLSLAIPQILMQRAEGEPSWTERFFSGMLAMAAQYGVPLAGGDTACSAPCEGAGAGASRRPGLAVADIVLIGAVRRGRGILRSGARVGDVLYVTGALGGAAAELAPMRREPERFVGLTTGDEREHPHLFPVARVAVGRVLAGGGAARGMATAAIDTSDGLSTDLRHICEESELAAEVDVAALPVHPVAKQVEAAGLAASALELALHGGEDYELLFTAPAGRRVPRKIAGVPVHAIGRMKRRGRGKPEIELVEADGKRRELEAGGWEHFKSEA